MWCIHRKLAASALALFISTVIVEYFYPNVICSWYWHPIPCQLFLDYGIWALPALPTLLAFALLILATILPDKKK